MNHEPSAFHRPWIDNPWMLDEAKSWIQWTKGNKDYEDTGTDAGIDFFISCSSQPDVALARLITLIHVADADEELLNQIVCGPIDTFFDQCPEDFIPTVRVVTRQQPSLNQCIDPARLR